MEKIAAADPPLILDVRSPLDIKRNPLTIPGARHMPMEKLPRKYKEIPGDREIIIYCS